MRARTAVEGPFAPIRRTTAGLPIVYVCDRIENLQHGLSSSEARIVAEAVDIRRRHFEAGRGAARAALAQLGVRAGSIDRGSRGEPEWPDGVAGSITHTTRLAAAAVARKEHVVGIGIDLEASEGLRRELWTSVLTPTEIHRVERIAHEDSGILAKAIFSAKEAVYKCIYPLEGEVFGFDAVEVLLNNELMRFSASPVRAFRGSRLLRGGEGYLNISTDFVAAAFLLPTEDAGEDPTA